MSTKLPTPFGYGGKYNPDLEYAKPRYSPTSIWAKTTAGSLGIPCDAIQIPTKDLKNTSDGAMLIDSISFFPGGEFLQVTRSTQAVPSLGGAFGIRMNIGGVPITDSYVPAWCFSPMMPVYDEQISGSGVGGIVASTHNSDVLYSAYKWRLPRPLYLPRSAALDVQVSVKNNQSLSGSTPSSNLEMNVVCEGRVISPNAPPPPMVDVPWVSHWDVPPQGNVLATTVYKSPESSLSNPHADPVFVERMLGRAWILQHRVGSGTSTNVPIDATFRAENYQPTLTLKDSLGHIMARDPISAAVLFGTDGSWEMGGAVMPPRSYWKMQITYPVYNFGASVLGPFQNQFAIVGHRRVPFASLGLASTN